MPLWEALLLLDTLSDERKHVNKEPRLLTNWQTQVKQICQRKWVVGKKRSIKNGEAYVDVYQFICLFSAPMFGPILSSREIPKK